MLKDMDSPKTSLKQGRLPFKMLDAKSDLGRKRKLAVADDSHSIAKSMKCAHKIPSDDCVTVSISCKEESEIENIPSVTSSPKTTERIRKVSQNCLNESKLSPTKQKSVKVKEAQIVEESAEIGTREKQVKESSQEKEEAIEITSDSETETTENHQKPDDCGSSVDHSGILTALDKSTMDKSSELNSSNVVTNNSLRTCFCSEDKFGDFAGASSSTAEKDKQEDTQEAPHEKQETINRKHHVKKPVMTAKKLKLTQEKMKARAKRKAEREMERERRKKLKQEIKENKERAKAMKDKEKQEKKEREEKERLEKRQQKQLLLDSKLEEKRRKEEEKQRKLDEKRKAEEERQRKLDEKRKAEEEEERKKEKAKAAFVSFFVKPAPTSLQQVDQQQHGLFRPFEVMKDMKLAPCVPLVAVENFNKERFEKLLSFQGEQQLYLEEMQNDKHKPYLYSKMNLRNEDTDNDVVLLDDDDVNNGKEKLRPKLLQFCENIRPPYWGTWRKKSKMVCGRQPLKKDEVHFDYDVDSDEEWDEGGPGESLSGTEDEKESDDDYEVDNEFLVPHGYLSNDEEDEDENSAVTPETKHALLKMREREFNDERSKKYSELKPNVIGCFQGNGIISFTEELRKSLEVYSIVALTTIPVITTDMLSKESDDVQSNHKPEKHVKAKKSFPEEAMPHFIKLVHGNTNGHQSVIREFREFWQNYCKQSLPKQSVITLKEEDSERTASFSRLCGNDQDVIDSQSSPNVAGSGVNEISKRQLKLALHDIAEWCRGKIGANKYCWWVHEEIRERYHLVDLPIPNCWHYVSMKNNIEKSHVSIKKFAKVIT